MGNCVTSRTNKNRTIERSVMVPPANISWDDTMIYVPPITVGRVIKVYDGDTFTLACCLNGDSTLERYYRFSVRLAGIDTPEMKSRNATEKSLATAAQTALSRLILNQVVELRNVKFEKYGRLLADVYVGNIHVNQYMIDNKHAVYYDGGTKPEWTTDVVD